MSIIQGVENVDVAIPSRMLEAQLVGEAESKLIAQLNAEGKRVVRIDHQKRAGGIGEWSDTHATITALWEADTENPTYKNYINRQKAEEERIKKQKQEALEAKAKVDRQKLQEKTKADTKLFWERHKKERLELTQELEWLKGLSDEEIRRSGQYYYVKNRISIINNILNRTRLGQKTFTEYEKVQIQYGDISKIRLTNSGKYNEIVDKYPILEKVTDLKADHEETFLDTIKVFLLIFTISVAPILLFIYMWDKYEEAYEIIIFLSLGFLSLCGIVGICASFYVLSKSLPIAAETRRKYEPYKKALKQANKEIDRSIVVKEYKGADEKATSIKHDFVHEEIKVQQKNGEVKQNQDEIIKSKYLAAIELQQNACDLEGYKKAATALEELMSPAYDNIIWVNDVVRRYKEVQAKIDELESAQDSNL